MAILKISGQVIEREFLLQEDSTITSFEGYDHNTYNPKSFSEENLAVYRNDKNFQYEAAEYEESEFAKMWRRFKYALFRMLGEGLSSSLFKWVVFGVAFLLIVWFLAKAEYSPFVAKKDAENHRYVEELDIRVEENVLKERMRKAKENGQWRDAVRYGYLLSLKSLHEKDLIQWKEYKLSSNYEKELNDAGLKTGFSKLTNYFNFSWYGNRTLDSIMYAEIENDFKVFMEKVEKS